MARVYEQYTDSAGNDHFADADIGDDDYYPFKLTPVLLSPTATVDDVTWTLQSGLTETQTPYIDGEYSICRFKATQEGTFEINVSVTSSESGQTKTENTKILLTVYD